MWTLDYYGRALFTSLKSYSRSLCVPVVFPSGVEREVQQQRLKDHLGRGRPSHPHLRLSHVIHTDVYEIMSWEFG